MGDLFDVEKLWVYGKNKNWKNRFKNPKNNTLPVISGITVNNGVNYYTNDLYDEGDVFADSLTISTRGEYSGTVTYHKGKFLLANNILVMQMPNFTLMQKIFIGSLINKLPYGGYNEYPRKETLKNNTIQLPTKDGKIDFEFMESFISELKEEHISELAAYLKVTGLDNYELTSDEKKSIDNFNNIKWGEYRIGDLFEISSTRSFNTNKLVCGDEYDYVTRTSFNQGVLRKTGYVNQDNINEKGTWSLGLLQMDFFYRKNPWYAGQFVRKIVPKISLDYNSIPYFTAILNKQKHKLMSVLVRDVDSTFLNGNIQLPTKDGKIDFEYIELFITAVQKLVIKDVVIYANNKINITKNVCNSK
ncbi:restriction endonuclease subunit S [Mycoplasma tauri]|uniref:restriction endonuclease subunit S n=1 Tax=Mycoplasma tauri TaxID=547987 RepID=UPI0022B7FF1B|nr:restriction endonuclease subunit S [Mycoplasma tauri]